jgi:hypothetical protein
MTCRNKRAKPAPRYRHKSRKSIDATDERRSLAPALICFYVPRAGRAFCRDADGYLTISTSRRRRICFT